MAEFERSVSVNAAPSVAFDYLADPGNLTEYVATMVQAEPAGPGRLKVAADVQGRHEEGEAEFQQDPVARRLSWSGGRPDYSGWLTVGEGDSADTSQVTIHISTPDADDRAEIERALDETARNIEQALPRGEA